MNLPVRAAPMPIVAAATDTMMQTSIRWSSESRNNIDAARATAAHSAMTRVKIHAFDCGCRPRGKVAGQQVNTAPTCASRSLNREGAKCFVRRVFEVKCIQYTLLATIMPSAARRRGHSSDHRVRALRIAREAGALTFLTAGEVKFQNGLVLGHASGVREKNPFAAEDDHPG